MLAFAKGLSGEFELAAQGYDREWALWESIAKLVPVPPSTLPRPETQAAKIAKTRFGQVKPHFSATEAEKPWTLKRFQRFSNPLVAFLAAQRRVAWPARRAAARPPGEAARS